MRNSFWTVSLDLDAMFEIKSLLYKDLILNSQGCRKSNQLLRHPHRFCLEPRTSLSVLKLQGMNKNCPHIFKSHRLDKDLCECYGNFKGEVIMKSIFFYRIGGRGGGWSGCWGGVGGGGGLVVLVGVVFFLESLVVF